MRRLLLFPENKYLRGYWVFNAFLFLISVFLFVVASAPRWLAGMPVGGLSEGGELIHQEKPDWVKDTFMAMNGKERVGQLFSVSLGGENGRLVSEVEPGFVGLFGEAKLEKDELRERISSWQDIAKGRDFPEILVMVDQEGGKVQRLKSGFERLPSLEEVCEELDENQIYDLGVRVGKELAGVGVNGVWGPVVDRTNAKSKVLDARTCSDDPSEIVVLVGEYVRGLEDGGVVSVVKHYPGLGGTKVDPHTDFGSVEEVDWEVFEPLILMASKKNRLGVMVTHVGVGRDALPCSVSGKCMAPLNKMRCRDDGCFLVFADALEMDGVADKLSEVEVAYMAVMGGVDVLVYGAESEPGVQLDVYDELVELYDNDPLFAARVDESVVRILKMKAGIFGKG